VNTACSVFKARYVLGVGLEDEAIALEVEVGGAFGILLMRRERLNIQEHEEVMTR
jgi:hypothetical protein